MTRADFDVDGGAWIDYPGPPGTIRTVSFVDVEDGRVDPALLRGKVVVVGATAQSLKDVFPVATSADQAMSGAEIQAASIQTVLDGLPLRSTPGWLDGLLIAVLGLLGAVTTLRLGPQRAALAGIVAAVAFAGLAQLAFNAGRGSSPGSTRCSRWDWASSARSASRRRSAPSSASACATCSRASCPRRSSTTSSRAPTTTCASAASARS